MALTGNLVVVWVTPKERAGRRVRKPAQTRARPIGPLRGVSGPAPLIGRLGVRSRRRKKQNNNDEILRLDEECQIHFDRDDKVGWVDSYFT